MTTIAGETSWHDICIIYHGIKGNLKVAAVAIQYLLSWSPRASLGENPAAQHRLREQLPKAYPETDEQREKRFWLRKIDPTEKQVKFRALQRV
jgi:hypothetical protein